MRPNGQTLYEWLYSITGAAFENRAYIEYRAENGLPDEFLVYYLVSDGNSRYFSNSAWRREMRISFCIMTRHKANLETKSGELERIAQANGLLFMKTMPDTYFEATGHWSRTIDFRYYEEVRK